MKLTKKLAGIMLALIMVFTMAIPAFAAGENHTITINNNATGHTYEAYQIFTGDLAPSGVLSNIVWGNGINSDAFLAAIQANAAFIPSGDTVNSFAGATTAEEVAEILALYATDSAEAQLFAQIAGQNLTATSTASTFVTDHYEITGLDAGYYLVKDQDDSVVGDDAYTRIILEVVKDTTVNPKSDKPAVEKKVKDINDSTDAVLTDWQDSADFDIGDAVNFKLTGTLPSNYADYATYNYIFHDTLSAGLTYNGDAKVYVVNGDDRAEVTDQFTITEIAGALSVSIADLKVTDAVATSKIVVEYTATLNENAVLGEVGNPNEVYLEYSNNPNVGGEGDTGETPVDVVIVFTYKTVINKVDENNEPLTGATFTLEKFVVEVDGADEYDGRFGTWTAIEASVNGEGTVFTFTGLDDGTYRLTETATPVGYNTIDPIIFEITAEHEILSADPALTELNGAAVGVDITLTPNLTEGSLTTDIVNKSGSLLPSTGGIGTTIFYIVGSLLVIGAGVLLVVKKRMSASAK